MRRILPVLMQICAFSLPLSSALAAGIWVERPEAMLQLWLNDIDSHRGNVRLVYATSPSLRQGRTQGWTYNIYVIQARPSGDFTQHRLYSGQSQRYAALAPLRLRRGHDQVAIGARSADGSGALLEMREIPAGDVLGRADIPQPRDESGRFYGGGQLRGATNDGNFYWASTRESGSRDQTTGIASWFELKPDGTVSGRGMHREPGARIRINSTFAAAGGGVGLVTTLTARGQPFLPDHAGQSVDHTVGERTITANVSGATRLLTTDPEGGKARFFGPPLAQEVRWSGQLAIPDDLPFQEIMRQNRQQMFLQQQAAARFRTQRSLLAGLDGARVRKTPEGYAVLARASVSRRLEPPAHGWYFTEVGPGKILRELRLEPVLEAEKLEPVDFHVTDNNHILLLAAHKRQRGGNAGVVLELDETGRKTGAIPVLSGGDSHVELKAMMPAARGLWIIGEGNDPDATTALWLEHVTR